MNDLLLIYADKITPRLVYTCKVIFEYVTPCRYQLTSSPEEYKNHQGPKINYSTQRQPEGIWIYPSGLLQSTEIFEQNVRCVVDPVGGDLLFGEACCELRFDVFSAVFYLISRYEEYLPHVKDVHGRFQPTESLAFRQGFLQKPVVNRWCLRLRESICQKYRGFQIKKSGFTYTATIDVDNTYAYKGKGFVRSIGSLINDLRSLNFLQFKNRFLTVFFGKKDPFDTIDYQIELFSRLGIEVIYFYLYSRFGPFDRNLPIHSPSHQQHIKFVADFASVGSHPSYRASEDFEELEYEITSLESTIRRPITKSRMHYLRFFLPSTFRHLMELGITDEYSMGYAQVPGFRAGICTPYPFYDLEMETSTDLIIHPFALMETTFIDYLKYSPKQAAPVIFSLIDEVYSVGGHLITVWHNRTFSEYQPEWRGWNQLHQEMLDYISKRL
ncbi:polysaccharide deacetylase family protein [Schleiferia thermophila]|uniref:polysaccharide deacetylase family protein n=1 Tax=Schleiferia thermophila TaxID=884107 RepID=UPI0004E72AF2|nr:polysaccharide deacetylase family protein [Schleiferia thermophila]KFD38229.1 hypothetical protein AT05_11140 [Schleiferia thermophila str. Yellowstone]GCD80680.1 hypothetical protein JCM30197_19270 [Schleiferia thermophila]